MRTFDLTVSTPDGNVFAGEALCITVRGSEGDLAVMAGHTPFVTSVVAGEVEILIDNDTLKTGKTDGGLITVSGDLVTFISGSFTWE
jgi:F-type H+-transporting ATPase subunit epsilon